MNNIKVVGKGGIRMPEKMRHGTVNCSCGQQFYFETLRTQINCIKCDKTHDISSYPEKEEIEEIIEEEQAEPENE